MPDHEGALVRAEEGSCFGVVVDEEEGNTSHNDGQETFEDEDPSDVVSDELIEGRW